MVLLFVLLDICLTIIRFTTTGTVPDYYTDAMEKLTTFKKHVTAKAALEAGLASKDKGKLREALDDAEDLDMQIAIMSKAREFVKDMEITRSPTPSEKTAAQPYDAAEEV